MYLCRKNEGRGTRRAQERETEEAEEKEGANFIYFRLTKPSALFLSQPIPRLPPYLHLSVCHLFRRFIEKDIDTKSSEFKENPTFKNQEHLFLSKKVGLFKKRIFFQKIKR